MTAINNIITHQHTLLTDLKAVITAEKAALIAQNADQLLSLAKDKSRLLDEIKATDEQLSSHEESQRLTTEADLIEQVASIKHALAECKQLNALNADLIEHSIASVNRFTQALQVSRNASSLTYDDKGRTSTISTLGSNLKA
ncbi:flagellar protein FlgN [Shewanella sp. AS1]|uniref:flagella synthesis protein FlgN n=1 Tax=Shewanella sp. AS1 TaxID=2907626 RepID=UPI001F1DE373|nr:flagellar protein FlgN [Shewanella sp. AS1]MCE9679990.1 flagellar protein FlgN [Shewanella sp. AS1]